MKTSTFYYKLLAVLVLSLLLSFLLPVAVQGQTCNNAVWYNNSWLYRKAITIDYTKVSSGPHTNFPILINITDTDLQARALASGNDILFTASDGTTKLNHEIESYTSGTGALVAWVQIPSLSSTVNTVIYMYYGNSGSANQQNVTGTWDANYAGVYHLNTVFTDATSNARNGANTGTTDVAGKIARGRGYTANSTNKITITGLMGNPANVTLSAWENYTSLSTNANEVVSLGDHLLMRIDNWSTAADVVSYYWDGTTYYSSVGPCSTSGWHYVSMTFDDAGNLQKNYVDGVQVSSTSATTSLFYGAGSGSNTIIGNHGNAGANYSFAGTIDEVRITSTVRSAGWLLTEYNNQNSPATFYSAGSQQGLKIFTGTGNFTTAARWTNSVVPVACEYLIIDGACTVDNSVTTDNVAYGPLVIGYTAARTLNWASSGTNTLNVTNVSSAFAGSALDMTNGGTLKINGTWSSTNCTFTSGTGTINVLSTITLPAAYTTYHNLTVTGTATLGVNTTVSRALTVSGTLQMAGFNITSDALSGAGTIASSSGTPTLTLGGSNGSTSFSGLIGSGAIAVIKNGTGSLTLSGTNTYTGGTTLNAGTLNIGNAQALGTVASTLIIAGGTIDNSTGGSLTTLNYPQTWSGDFTFTGTNSLNMGTGAVSMSATRTVTASANTLTVGGVISGTGFTLIKAGAGALTLNGTNTFTGGVTLNAGTLNLGNTQALGTVAGTFTIAGGTIDNTSGGSLTTLNYPQTWSGNYTFTGSNNLNLGTGTITMSSDIQITTTANTLTVGGTNNNGTRSLTKAGAGSLTFGSTAVTLNSLTISAGTLTSTSGNLSLAGNYTNNGTYTHNSGTAIFNGTANQTIGGSNSTTFYNVTLNNTGISGSDVITLSKPITISNTLTLTDGILATDATNLLTLTNPATSATTRGNTSGPSFVSGPVRWNGLNGAGPFIFPTGTITSGRSNVAVSGITSATDFTASYTKAAYSNVSSAYLSTAGSLSLTTVSKIEYWDVARTSGTGSAAVTLYWENAATSYINSCANNGNLKVAHYNTVSNKWENANSSGTVTVTGGCTTTLSGTVKSDVMSSFSPFTFGSGSGGVNPLPIELLNFNAVFNGTTTDISWQTASEINNNYFTVERSTDGINFTTPLGTVPSKALNGNSTTVLSYTINDPNTVPGVYYYRLKQTDFDFKHTYSNVVAVTVTKSIEFSFDLAPNPNNGNSIDVLITTPVSGMVTLKIYDIAGNRLHMEDIPIIEGEKEQFKIQLKDKLESGTYIVMCILNGDLTKKKLMTVVRQ